MNKTGATPLYRVEATKKGWPLLCLCPCGHSEFKRRSGLEGSCLSDKLLGILFGKQNSGQSLLWIRWTENVVYRLNGGATPNHVW